MWRGCFLNVFIFGMMCGFCSAQEMILFNRDFTHPWNACYKVLRQTGNAELKDGDFLRKALESIDELLSAPTKTSAGLPTQQGTLRRATMQREAWRVFDLLVAQYQSTARGHRSLRYRLAKLISLTALNEEEIGELKTNYTIRPLGNELPRDSVNDLDLPEDLFDPDGDWVQLTHKTIRRVALTHESSHGGRSEFLLFLRFPKGRAQAKAYLKDFNEHAAVEAERRREILFRLVPRRRLLPALPEFPQGLKVILVERMLVISESGIPKTTPIILSIAFNDLSPTISERTRTRHRIRSAVFEASVEHLLKPGATTSLRRLEFGEPFFGELHFPKGLQQCSQCHADNGLATLHSNFGGVVVPDDRSVLITTAGSESRTPQWKLRQSDYSMLLGYLEAFSCDEASEEESMCFP